MDALARCRRCRAVLGSSLQIPAVRGAGMGATTFGTEQLDAMGATTLDEFASWLARGLMPRLAGSERVQALLDAKLLDMMHGSIVSETQRFVAHTPTCEEEAMLVRQSSALPRSTGAYVRLCVADNVCRLELSDPSHFNALSTDMASDMQAAGKWLAAQQEGSIGGAVLQGAGDHFCPGGNMYRAWGAPSTSLVAAARGSIDLFDGFCRLHTLAMPLATAAHGAVLGGGLAICLLTDHVVCNEAATWQVGERSRHIHPAGLLARTLADAAGVDVALNLYLTDGKLTGAHAHERGLVQAVASSTNASSRSLSRKGLTILLCA